MEEAAAMYRREEKEDSVSPPHSENVGALLGTAYQTLCPACGTVSVAKKVGI